MHFVFVKSTINILPKHYLATLLILNNQPLVLLLACSTVVCHLISEIFVGQLKSELKFDDCGHRSVTFDPFWDLSLPIPKVRLLGYHK